MARETLTQAAFVPSDPDGRLAEAYYALAFPRHWREVILDLYRHGKPNPDRRTQVPIRRLNNSFATLAPDLVSVARNAALDDALPWLYTTNPYPRSIISSFVLAWLKDLQPTPEAFPLIAAASKELQPESLQWDLVSVDLLAKNLSPGGTAVPEARLFQLLPDVLARRIANYGIEKPYEYNGEQVRFYCVAAEHGAELMSWPPRNYTPRGENAKLWSYSGTIRITLQTVPFDPTPRIHIHTGIRRWIRGKVWRASTNDATAYLLADSPWLAGSHQTQSFTRTKLGWSKTEGNVVWKDLRPAITEQLSASLDFPKAHQLETNPDKWLDATQGIQAGVAHHTMMGYHGVAPGLLPHERRRLIEWIAKALQPDFRIDEDLIRVDGRAAPHAQLKERKSIPTKKVVSEKVEAAKTANVIIDEANARRHRQLLADACDGRLECHILFQTKECRDELIRAAEDHLGLHGSRVDAIEETWQWNTPEVEVRIHAVAFALGGQLGGDKPPKTAEQVQLATATRRAAVRELCDELSEQSNLVFVELDDKDAFPIRTADPKFAIRLGCADAGRVSQFLVTFRDPSETEIDGEVEDSRAHRADAAWRDGLRQLGARFIPGHTLGDLIPADLNQVAFWLIKRRSDKTKLGSQFTPIAVLIRPGQKTIMGRTPDSDSWLPYPDLLRQLVGRVRPESMRTEEQQQTEAALFMRKVLFGLRHEQNIVVIHAQNSRSRMPFFANGGGIQDMFQLGGGPVQRLGLHGKNIRLLRVRTSDRDETAQCWAPYEDGTAGFSKGLWKPALSTEDNRVYYSTTDRSSKIHTSLDTTKLTTHVKNVKVTDKATGEVKMEPRQSIQPRAIAWNPGILEIAVFGLPRGERPETWAMYLHQQRQPDEHREGLGLPLALYLAERASQYALPHEFEVEPEPASEPDLQAGPEPEGEQ